MADPIREELPRLRGALAADPERVAAEFAGLAPAQLRFRREEPVWARWSAETQLRHMANVPVRWLVHLNGETLRGRGYAIPGVDTDAIAAAGGRHVPPALCPDTGSLIAFLRPFFALALEILDRERPGDLRALACERAVDPEAVGADSPDRPIEFWRMAAGLHPFGVREDPGRSGVFTIELFAALRQIHWEILAHLRTVQRLKGLLGLPARVDLPREGYLTLPKFYDDAPPPSPGERPAP